MGKNKDITVVIPVCKADEEYVSRTTKSINSNAATKLDLRVVFDNGDGIRKIMNREAKQNARKYLVKLDAHCSLSPKWDLIMMNACEGDHLVTTAVDTLDTNKWCGKGQLKYFVTLNGNLRTQWVGQYRPSKKLEDTLGMIGQCWMIRSDYYNKIGGCDEELGPWGALGPEWTLKVWLTGGRVLLASDVICSHLFRKTTPFEVNRKVLGQAFVKLCYQWIVGEDQRRKRIPGWLVDKFSYMASEDGVELQIPILGVGAGYGVTSAEKKRFLQFIKFAGIKKVLEFGTGKTTIAMGLIGCDITSYETNSHYINTIKSLVDSNCVVKFWDGHNCPEQEEYDMVFVDGPAGGPNRNISYQQAVRIRPRYIIGHDIYRKWESNWINRYLQDYRCINTIGTLGIYERL